MSNSRISLPAVVLSSASNTRRQAGIDEGKEQGSEEEIGIVGDGDVVVVETERRAQEMYDRFSGRRKSTIVAIVSFAGLLGPFSSSSFLPSIPAISVDLQTTATVLNISVGVFILVLGISPLIYANYAGVCESRNFSTSSRTQLRGRLRLQMAASQYTSFLFPSSPWEV